MTCINVANSTHFICSITNTVFKKKKLRRKSICKSKLTSWVRCECRFGYKYLDGNEDSDPTCRRLILLKSYLYWKPYMFLVLPLICSQESMNQVSFYIPILPNKERGPLYVAIVDHLTTCMKTWKFMLHYICCIMLQGIMASYWVNRT